MNDRAADQIVERAGLLFAELAREELLAADANVRCWSCDKLLGQLLSRPWWIVCPRCRAGNVGRRA